MLLPANGIQYGSEQGGSTQKATDAEFFTGSVNTTTQPVDPFVSGYAFWKWTKLPEWVEKEFPGFREMTEKNFKSFQGLDDIEISAVAQQLGFAAGDTNFAGGISMNDGFSMSHNEYSGLVITNAYAAWVSGVRDPVTGVATYPAKYNLEYAARNHTGEGFYIVTRPDANNKDNPRIIEKAFYYTNVMPTKIPLGHLNFQAGSQESPTIEMPFFAKRHMGGKVEEAAKSIIRNTYNFTVGNDFESPRFR